MKDQLLVSNFLKNRSEKSFQALYRAKTPQIYQVALRLSQDDVIARELVQQMWIIAISKIDGFEWRSELKTWLIGILFNLYRALRKKQEREIKLTETTTNSTAYPVINDKIDLEEAIAQLPPGYRQILILHDIEGYKHREIAEILDITEGTSKSQLSHARKSMREFLK
ncbi:RNA polymerase sigma factor [Ekhidna sp.]|uniref:RNA polymerase sigma factor n=1 Tax=Ekhidna sp. TaxID=2608089 RepID=UPI00329803DC